MNCQLNNTISETFRLINNERSKFTHMSLIIFLYGNNLLRIDNAEYGPRREYIFLN